jgi:hypothetical protein
MKGTNEIHNGMDLIDSRNVEERIAYLSDEVEEDLATDDEKRELETLLDLHEWAEGYCDWLHGATLVRDTYFKEYAQELAEDVGAIDTEHGWPAYCIDWDRAARDLQMDYIAVEFDGVTYWVQ